MDRTPCSAIASGKDQKRTRVWAAALLLLAGCTPRDAAPPAASEPPLRVKTAVVQPAPPNARLRLSGIVRARQEIPLAFQVAGRIVERRADAGLMVSQGEALFVLDEREFRAELRGAEARLRAAEIEAADARTERERVRGLLADRAVSQQDFDRADTLARAAEGRLIAARSAVELAQHAFEYTRLTAPRLGLLLEVTGEVGQFVGPGQVVAVLAAEGDREIEVALPSSVAAQPPAAGRVWLDPRANRSASPCAKWWAPRIPSVAPGGRVIVCPVAWGCRWEQWRKSSWKGGLPRPTCAGSNWGRWTSAVSARRSESTTRARPNRTRWRW